MNMMRLSISILVCAAAIAALPACGFTDARETIHRSVDVGAAPTVEVNNSVGGVTVRSWDKPAVDITAVKSAHSADALKNIDINIEPRSSGVVITTVNRAGSSFWSGGGVGYTILVPASASLKITNETGGVRIDGVNGDVLARTTTGGVQANLGTVTGNRSIDMRVTTGGIDLTIARDSNATVDMHATVGGVKSDFDSDRIGSGTGRIHLVTTTGGVVLRSS